MTTQQLKQEIEKAVTHISFNEDSFAAVNAILTSIDKYLEGIAGEVEGYKEEVRYKGTGTPSRKAENYNRGKADAAQIVRSHKFTNTN